MGKNVLFESKLHTGIYFKDWQLLKHYNQQGVGRPQSTYSRSPSTYVRKLINIKETTKKEKSTLEINLLMLLVCDDIGSSGATRHNFFILLIVRVICTNIYTAHDYYIFFIVFQHDWNGMKGYFWADQDKKMTSYLELKNYFILAINIWMSVIISPLEWNERLLLSRAERKDSLDILNYKTTSSWSLIFGFLS